MQYSSRSIGGIHYVRHLSSHPAKHAHLLCSPRGKRTRYAKLEVEAYSPLFKGVLGIFQFWGMRHIPKIHRFAHHSDACLGQGRQAYQTAFIHLNYWIYRDI